MQGHKEADCNKNKQGIAKKTNVAAAAVVDPNAIGYCGFCKTNHKGGSSDVLATICWKKDPNCNPQWLKDKEKSKQESSAVKIIVTSIDPDDIWKMMNEQDSSFKPCARVAEWDEWDESPPNSFDDTEESNTEFSGIQIKLDTAEIAAKCVVETKESYTEVGGVPFPRLSHTESYAFKKELCTQSTGNNILTKCEDGIQSGEFQEPDDTNLPKSRIGTGFQELNRGKEPAVHANIVPDNTNENNKSSLNINNNAAAKESTLVQNGAWRLFWLVLCSFVLPYIRWTVVKMGMECLKAQVIYNKSVQDVHGLTKNPQQNEKSRPNFTGGVV